MKINYANTLLNNLDPKIRLLAAIGTAICFSCIQTTTVAWVCLILASLLAIISKVPLVPLLKRLAMVNIFILFLWLTIPLSVSGTTLLQLGSFKLSHEGITLSLLITLKCNAIALCCMVFFSQLHLPAIGAALKQLHIPDKLIFIFLFTCRYIHVLKEEWQKLQTAAKLRGFRAKTSMHTYTTIANMLGFTLINSLDRSQRIYEAMLLRGFNGEFHTLTKLDTTQQNHIIALLFFSLLTCLLATDLYLR